MLTAAEIGNIGEKHAAAYLRANGWSCYQNTQLPGATDIEATSGNRSLLVQVKTAIHPAPAAYLSTEELNAIKSRARRIQGEAWLAQILFGLT
jgi:Holliday junction resolvase